MEMIDPTPAKIIRNLSSSFNRAALQVSSRLEKVLYPTSGIKIAAIDNAI